MDYNFFFFAFRFVSTTFCSFVYSVILLAHWIQWKLFEWLVNQLFWFYFCCRLRVCAKVYACAPSSFSIHSGNSINVEVAQRVLDNILIKWQNKYKYNPMSTHNYLWPRSASTATTVTKHQHHCHKHAQPASVYWQIQRTVIANEQKTTKMNVYKVLLPAFCCWFFSSFWFSARCDNHQNESKLKQCTLAQMCAPQNSPVLFRAHTRPSRNGKELEIMWMCSLRIMFTCVGCGRANSIKCVYVWVEIKPPLDCTATWKRKKEFRRGEL